MISKILEVLEINSFVFLQMAVVIILSFLTGKFLIKPVLSTFDEREKRTKEPMERAREMVAKGEELAGQYDEKLKGAAREALTLKRARLEEALKSERALIEDAQVAADREIEDISGRIEKEKEEAMATLREESAAIANAIVEKILGRSVA